ncbi:MAG: NADH/ubiquinone/plastoquinone (complex I) [Candidatus Infernicultor aquiphilus]|uniref:NADH/ubiquinone/plastoquinone (Complex I) n=1 Tax=Candidatus Infernicultor aquiphilus TaxID=1805029 RepID=A0A1J5G3H3_9BACT|nr:monovalent cation/H+ antiporter subunit D family protein [bacterium]OIP66892.1 MAG: NADH/ubiquinone/plastoquinone (complex I) [Candidatus Atribacteria bacterium CG2_30_33_13]PIU25248.1 MAG: NADH/ubiquinone/plastoquinone (complex I) [Candidatus Atribacteria bacterium CG08_land_8_20_14_0_20_33_29]PIW11650.1 MAG: NADH/ubiquinone/plastoquinone (complex I) [Candidatus Atribacteria bacterium CG17_big_fil_post_rev_8_21_14_2_50_34_11]PIX34609.1 MAG: NADH/ubiquinone/plastoquinone (complex I) [Candida
MIAISHIIPLFVAISLLGAFIISIIGKRLKWIPDVIGNITTLILLGLSVLAMWTIVTKGTLVYSVGSWKLPIGIALVLDGLTAFMLITVNLIAFSVSIYSISYMERFTSKWKFYTLFLLMVAGMNGVVVSGDIFNLFVFLEIASVASYALVAFGTERHELEAAFKYTVMSSVGSLFLLLGIVFLYSYTSTLNMADMANILAQKSASNIIIMVIVLFITGFGLKAALVPFHAWLPDAHPSAPAPISAMLSGVLIKSLGIYTLCRIFYNVIGINPTLSSILMILGTLSMVIGVFLAIGQWDFKRLLAYHSISQIGYVILGIGLGTPLGIIGGLFHLFNHSVFKSLLFLNSGAVEYATGTRDLKKMGGLIAKMPVTGTTSLVASMSIAGIPPFNGFWSKLIIIIAAVQANRLGYAFWAVLASILTLASFTKVMKYAFFGKPRKRWSEVKEVPIFMKLAMVTLAIICVIGGVLLISNINQIFLKPASDVLLEGTKYADIVFKGIQ